ncbi:MAG: hypothetical protein A2293_03800 [Elusimicrobia bacterium RIFOXYB2_FULL_49_7]|nr:MAG: hypothetical protein A2293_03800 [Elusimicrobia bacterium RIFOXYB2_FULL_49_7]
MLGPGTIETGIGNVVYQTDKTEFINNAGTIVLTHHNAAVTVPFYFRYAFTDSIEAYVSIPYSCLFAKTEPAGAAAISITDAGLADPSLAGKYSFQCSGWDMSGAAEVTIPAGKTSSEFNSGFRQGWNITPLFAAGRKLGSLRLNTNLSYRISGEYEDELNVKTDIGNELLIGAGIELPCRSNENLLWLGEVFYKNVTEHKLAGIIQKDTAGEHANLIVGLRYNKGSIKTKLGVDFGLGEEKHRDYDYRIIAGFTYLISL